MTLKRLAMTPMVGAARWMTRVAGPVARAITAWIAEREVMACGVRLPEGGVGIIYSPYPGHRDHRIVRSRADGWQHAPSEPAPDFVPGLVLQATPQDATVGDEYRVLADTPTGGVVGSPLITIKESTSRISRLRVEPLGDGALRVEWPPAHRRLAMLFFVAVEQPGFLSPVGIYTRETSWTYPAIGPASLLVGNPFGELPPLVAGKPVRVRYVAVDYEGWVPVSDQWDGLAL